MYNKIVLHTQKQYEIKNFGSHCDSDSHFDSHDDPGGLDIKMPTIVHFDIPADDIEGAKKFYSDLFGWKIENGLNQVLMIWNTGW
jgi:hypothetical protein